MRKFFRIIYLIIITYILLIIFLPKNEIYYSLREHPTISNLIIGLILIIPIALLVKININVDDDKYKKILVILSIVTFSLQIILIKSTYFYTDWDVKTIREIVNNNDIVGNYYLTKYPNMLFYLSIIKFYNHIPLIGKYYFPLLIFNAVLVNLSGILTTLTIKRFTNNFNAIIGYIIISIIVILSPWINIPYTDTFVIPIPIAIIYIYTKDKKRLLDYFFIGFLSILGYYIKPTALIVLIGIVMLYAIDTINKKTKFNLKIIAIIFSGMILAYTTCNISIKLTEFKPCKTTRPFNIIHYMAMGQNNESYGLFNEKDVEESDLYGNRQDIKKIINRIKERIIWDQFRFLKVKTLLNFNDGTFAWGREGNNFYYKVLAKNTKLSRLLKNYFYKDYKYNFIFNVITQAIWILILILSLFAATKDKIGKNTIMYLSIIGITIFLTIFECRARYVYCYTPIFVTMAMIGLDNIKSKKI